MKKLRVFQVDAFTDALFKGNPAAVVLLDVWLSDTLMQSIAEENNLAETAFIVPNNNGYEIRWFTPTVEVDLCGHATLASAYVVFNLLKYAETTISFHSPRSGLLNVTKENDLLFLDFPADSIVAVSDMETLNIDVCIDVPVLEVYKGKTDYIAVVENEESLRKLRPNFQEISKLDDARGLIVTAAGVEVDFVSRFFAPQSGVDEDPVTGSAHTSLTPLWAKKLGKIKMIASQLSTRGGYLICEHKGGRCSIGGKAKLYLQGEIVVD